MYADFLADDSFLHVTFPPSRLLVGVCQLDRFRLVGWNLLSALGLDLDLNASRELQAHQSLHRLIGRSQDINQSLVGAHLKLLAAVLIFVDGTQNGDDLLLCRQRHGPETLAPVRFAVSTIFSADASTSL